MSGHPAPPSIYTNRALKSPGTFRKERINVDSFANAVEDFLKSLPYVGEVDSATLYGLRTAATALDANLTTSLLQEYNKTIRYIKSLAPVVEDEDEDDDLLSPSKD